MIATYTQYVPHRYNYHTKRDDRNKHAMIAMIATYAQYVKPQYVLSAYHKRGYTYTHTYIHTYNYTVIACPPT